MIKEKRLPKIDLSLQKIIEKILHKRTTYFI